MASDGKVEEGAGEVTMTSAFWYGAGTAVCRAACAAVAALPLTCVRTFPPPPGSRRT